MRTLQLVLIVVLSGLMPVTCLETTTAASSLSMHLLSESDAPSGFLAIHTRQYRQFTRNMSVGVSYGGYTKMVPVCLSPSGLAHDGWELGVIQAFDTRTDIKHFQDLRVCAWQFRQFGGAQAAYGLLVAVPQSELRYHRGRVLTSSRIGVSSLAIRGTGRNSGYEIVFQHGNRVLVLSYNGPKSFSGTQFIRLAQTLNGRLG